MIDNTLIKFKLNDGVIKLPIPTKSVSKFIELINEESSMEFISVFKSNEVPFTELPDFIKKKVSSILESYSKCTVTFENGRFNIYVGDCIRSQYPIDYFICKTYRSSDL